MTSNSEEVTTQEGEKSQKTKKTKRNSNDVGWRFVTLCDETNDDKWKCNYCLCEYSGGVFRAKQHIAGATEQIRPCSGSTEEDKKLCLEALQKPRMKKLVKIQEDKNIRSEVEVVAVDEIEQMEGRGSQKVSRTLGSMDKYVSNINVDVDSSSGIKRGGQQNINEVLFKQRTTQVHEYLARWVYEFGVPFHAVDNDSFKQFVEAIGRYGLGYQPPSQYLLREPLLKGEVDKMETSLKSLKEEWVRSGCSIMTDAWSDRTRRSIMNLCVNSRSGTTFLSSKEASFDAHTGEYIFEYVDGCIEELGEDKVVQVVTDNASNNMAAAKLLLEKRPRIFWTPCATHSFNLMLEAIGKISPYKNTISKAKSFTIFIYSHHKTLALMRKLTKGNIIRPGVTRFATSFLTLQSLDEKKEELRQMVSSKRWEKSDWGKSKKGRDAYDTMVKPSFWNGVTNCLKVFTPLVKVLRLVDGDVKPAMGFVYGELKKAKEETKVALKQQATKYKPILDIVDAKGKGRIDTPLHLTAYLLNPFYYYNTGATWTDEENELVMEGCIERFYPDLDIQDKVINVELGKYKNKDGAFGRVLATKGCEKYDDNYDPILWWSNYGNGVPYLQNLATRILSLTTSSSGCERNWSVFEGIHTKKRNRLNAERMNKLVYVQFNARLMNKRKKCGSVDVLCANESTHAQSWMVDGLVEKEVDEIAPTLEEVREVDEDDFVSDEEEDHVDDDEDEIDESNKERDEEMELEET